ncbi:MAG: AMP-binding protein [Oscillospiraceae bacterium]|nr:AMP-binding protein [Oscillospiraceae bacterium]
MKIAFSTLACPGSSWEDIYSMAKDIGFDGIEIRGLGSDISAYSAAPFTDAALPATIAKLSSLRLSIPCLSSNCCLKYANKRGENLDEITAYIELAKKLGTPYIRILADLLAAADGEVDDELVISQLRALAAVAEKSGVTLLVETNGVYADTARLRSLLEQVASDAVAALWDLHHPYRFFAEAPEQTVQNLGAYIKHVHIKDSVAGEGGKIEYKLMGEGDLPIDAMIRGLRSINYEGFVSLEWLKRWSDDLEDAGVVIPHFANYMSAYTESPVILSSQLFDNKTKTGKYIWEKETLIDLTFPQLLERVVEEFPDQCAFRYTTHDYTRTYREFRDDVDAFARALISLGVRRGDKVSIWATNVPQWFITFWAATKIGAVLVTVNTAYKIHEAEYLLRQSDTHTLVMIDGFKDSDYVGIIQKLCPELAAHTPGEPLHSARLPFLRNVITVESEQPGCLTWEGALAYADRTPIELVYSRMAMISRHDVCNMQYTSGTTGFPKGVMLTHYNIVNNGKNIGDRMDLSTADRFLIQVPMFHCFGMVLTMTASVTHGSTMAPLPAFSATLSLKVINDEKITAVNGVPTMFIAMLGHEDFGRTDFSHMRTGIMAGSPCPVKTMQDVLDKMNMSDITIVFGQTESSPGCTMSTSEDPVEVKVNTVGRPLPGIECKIVDIATGEDLADDMTGEFVARGYNIMKGYYKMPTATANAIDEGGWLHTGDLALRRPDGNYKITGRIRDMIIRGGENIYPKEIEDFLYTHEKVRDVQVIGVPDAHYGEEIMACVILNEGAAADGDEIKKYVNDHMARQKVPKYVRFVDEFPMNAAGKILKYRMVEEAVELLGLQDGRGGTQGT